MFINILLKIHFEVDKQLSIMYYMLSLKENLEELLWVQLVLLLYMLL